MVSRRVLLLKRRPGDSILRFDGECVSLDAILWWFRFHLFTRCGCSILFTSVLPQWYSMYGWMNIQDVMSGWFEVETEHQATGLATLATCHSPPFEKVLLSDSICFVGAFIYVFTRLRLCPLTPAQVRKEQDGLVHQADCSFLP